MKPSEKRILDRRTNSGSRTGGQTAGKMSFGTSLNVSWKQRNTTIQTKNATSRPQRFGLLSIQASPLSPGARLAHRNTEATLTLAYRDIGPCVGP
jgi:hypothetical protein